MKCFLALVWLFVFCLLFASKNYVVAQDLVEAKTISNFELLLSLSNGIIEKAIRKSMLPKDSANIILKASKKDSNNWLIEKKLWSYLNDSDYTVYYDNGDSLESNPSEDYETYLIDFNTIEIGINYKPDVARSSKLKRIGYVAVEFTILECETGKILLNDIITEDKTDWIDLSEKENLENPNISVTVGKVFDNSRTAKFKPFIVTAVAGTIVYLFYAIRSR